MSRPKIARKSTNIDMTAMCDVAFLLLSFFILTTKFKPSEAVTVSTPNSVAAKVAPEKDFIMISLTADGKAFLSVGDSQGDRDKKQAMLEELNTRESLGLTPTDIAVLIKAPFIGAPLSQLKQVAGVPIEKMNGQTMPGIPIEDTANNQLFDWIRAATVAYQGEKLQLVLKGDNLAKYPAFKNIIAAFKKNEQFKFQMVTNPEAVPQGTYLWNANMSGKTQEEL
jgi:biopolymer transport protein ExbD